MVAALGPIPSEEPGKAVLFTVIIAGDADQTAKHVDELNSIRERYSTGGTTMYMLGETTSTDDFKKISEEDLRKGEGIGVLVAIVVLIVVFGSLVAGITPIVMGIFAIGVALRSRGCHRSGLALQFLRAKPDFDDGPCRGHDYSLFIVSRYREERARGRDKFEAIGMSAPRRQTQQSSSAG